MVVAAPIDLEATQSAIVTWVKGSTGIGVAWRNARAIQLPYPFVGLLITKGPTADSEQWEERTNFDATRALGKEIEVEKLAPGEMTVECQFYSKEVLANKYASQALAGLQDDEYLQTLMDSNIAVQTTTPIQSLDFAVRKQNVSRAVFSAVFNIAMEAKSYRGYISSVQVVNVGWGTDVTFPY